MIVCANQGAGFYIAPVRLQKNEKAPLLKRSDDVRDEGLFFLRIGQYLFGHHLFKRNTVEYHRRSAVGFGEPACF